MNDSTTIVNRVCRLCGRLFTVPAAELPGGIDPALAGSLKRLVESSTRRTIYPACNERQHVRDNGAARRLKHHCPRLCEAATPYQKMESTFIKRLATDIPMLNANALAFMLAHQPGADAIQLAEHPAVKNFRAAMAPQVERLGGGLAIVPIQGTLAYGPNPFEMAFEGVEDSREVTKMLNNVAADDGIEGVLLRMDTPGGMLLGGPEMADAVARMRAVKPVVCHIGGMGASLGYMIASQASQIVANRSAIVGSIGVIASVTDYTALLDKLGVKFEYFTNAEAKFKTAGQVGTSLSDDQRDNIQTQVDSAFQLFKGMVLGCRPNVPLDAMQGQTFRGSEAKAYGLVDNVGDESFALSVLKSRL